jgi:hypothetical protein
MTRRRRPEALLTRVDEQARFESAHDAAAAAVAHDKGMLYVRVLVSVGIAVLRSLFLVRLLSAFEIGAYRLATSWVGYFGFLTLGTVETYFIRAPGLLQAGHGEDVKTLRGVALTMSISAAVVTGIGIAALSSVAGLGGVTTSLAFGLNGFLLALLPYLTTAHWVSAEFSTQARREVTGTLIGAGLGLAGLALAGLDGLLCGSAAGLVFTLWLARDRFWRTTWRWPAWPSFRESVLFGASQSLYLFMQGLVFSVDLQVLAVLWRTNAVFGLYAFGTLLIAAIRTAATAGAVVEKTRLLEHHGQPGRDRPTALLHEADQERRLDNVIVSTISLMGLAGVIVAAPVAFPRFVGIVEVMGAFTISIVAVRLGYFHAVTLSMRRGQFAGVLAAVVAIGANAAWSYVSVLLRWPMQAVAMAPAIGGVVWSALTVLACEWSLTGRTTWSAVPRLLTPLLPLLPVAALSAGRPWYVNLAIVALALSLYLLHTGRSDAESFGTATSLLKQLFISPVRFMFGAPTPRLRGGR